VWECNQADSARAAVSAAADLTKSSRGSSARGKKNWDASLRPRIESICVNYFASFIVHCRSSLAGEIRVQFERQRSCVFSFVFLPGPLCSSFLGCRSHRPRRTTQHVVIRFKGVRTHAKHTRHTRMRCAMSSARARRLRHSESGLWKTRSTLIHALAPVCVCAPATAVRLAVATAALRRAGAMVALRPVAMAAAARQLVRHTAERTRKQQEATVTTEEQTVTSPHAMRLVVSF
jgi:hypothetical protein